MASQSNKVARFYFKRHAKRAAKACSASHATISSDDDPLEDIPPRTPDMSDFVTLRSIKRGPLGEVKQVVKRSDLTEFYALKIFPKNDIRRTTVFSGVMAELEAYKRIACCRRSKFLNEALAAFQDDTNLYLLLPFKLTVLRDAVGIIPNAFIPHVTLQIATGLSTLHSLGIIHRNLRPSNILLSPTLNVTITDFSLAYLHHIPTPLQRSQLCLRDAVGSVDYLAPEVLLRRGYDNMVDFWALGIVMFEILHGKLPFTVESLAEYYKRPRTGCAPYWTTEEGIRRRPEASVLAGLLQCNPMNRCDLAGLKNLEYFQTALKRQPVPTTVMITPSCSPEPAVRDSEKEYTSLVPSPESNSMVQGLELRNGWAKFNWVNPKDVSV